MDHQARARPFEVYWHTNSVTKLRNILRRVRYRSSASIGFIVFTRTFFFIPRHDNGSMEDRFGGVYAACRRNFLSRRFQDLIFPFPKPFWFSFDSALCSMHPPPLSTLPFDRTQDHFTALVSKLPTILFFTSFVPACSK